MHFAVSTVTNLFYLSYVITVKFLFGQILASSSYSRACFAHVQCSERRLNIKRVRDCFSSCFRRVQYRLSRSLRVSNNFLEVWLKNLAGGLKTVIIESPGEFYSVHTSPQNAVKSFYLKRLNTAEYGSVFHDRNL